VGKKIVVTGGGTGGHVYPGIAVIRAFQIQDPEAEFYWIGSVDGMENKIVPLEKIPLFHIPVGKLNLSGGSIGGKIKTLLKMPLSFWACFKILRSLKPNCVLGVGGFVSGPVVLMAAFMRIRTAIWEPNAHPGMANRWLSPFVDKIFLVFEEAKPFLFGHRKIQRVGLPIRKEIEALSHQQKNIENKKLNVLIFCGSQGARSVNQILQTAIVNNSERFSQFNIRHQTGTFDFEKCQQAYQKHSFVQAYEYLNDMAEHLNWADVVVCRAGTGSVFEMAACRKPVIFIPLPWASDDHQTKNAKALVKDEAAYLIPQSELTSESLLSHLEKFKNNPRAAMVMGQRAHRFYTPRAAEVMAETLRMDVSS